MGFIVFKMASINEMVTWMNLCEQLVGSLKHWSNRTLIPTFINKNPSWQIHLLIVGGLDLYVEQLILFNSLGWNEQDETMSSLGWSEQCFQSLGHWSNKTLIPTSTNTNPSMHNHLPIGLVPFGRSSFYLSWK